MSLEGKITTLTPDNISGVYQNPQGQVSTSVRVRLSRQTAPGVFVVIDESPEIPKVVNPGDTMTITWEETEFEPLVWGTDYQIDFQITDALGTVGAWGSQQLFHTNKAPLTPGNITPANNAVMTGTPLITFTATDPDDTPVSEGGNLQAWVEITGPYRINGTFDVDASTWTNPSVDAGITVTRDRATDQVRNGAGSYKHQITEITNTGDILTESSAHPAVQGYSYSASVWRRSTSVNLAGLLRIRWYDESDVFISDEVSPQGTVVENTWQQISVGGVAPEGATQFRVALQTLPVSLQTGSVWFDDVLISSGVRGVVEATKVGTGAGWRATPTDEMVSANGQYNIRARSFDGILYSPWSGAATFTRNTGPEVEIVSPTPLQEIDTTRPLIEWELSGSQGAYRVILRDRVTNAVRYDSNYIINGLARSYVIPAGIVQPIDSLSVQVLIQDTSPAPLVGFSPIVNFTVSYPPPPAPEDLSVGYQMFTGDDEPTAIRLNWTPVNTAPDLLVGMEIWRMENSKPDTKQLIGVYEGYDPGFYIDNTARSGVNYRYFVRQSARQGTFERYGEEAYTDGSITLNSSVLEVVASEDTLRVVMKFWSSRTVTLTQHQTWNMSAGGDDWTESLSYGTGRDISINWQVVDSDQYGGASGYTARQHIEMLERIYDDQYILSFRDGRGRHDYFRFNGNVTISDRNTGPAKYEVTIPLRRIEYVPAQMINVL